jgi:DNA-binding CsgD family transcriptional regulator
LGLSEATVRKHLENIYVRLNVLNRTEALARVGPLIDAA